MRRSKEYIINEQVLEGRISDKVMAIEEIFGMPHLSKNRNQQVGNFRTNKPQRNAKAKDGQRTSGLIGREEMDEAAEHDIILFCHDFMLHVVNELRETMCFFVIIDNASFMNAPSWKLFDLIASNPVYMILVMNIQTNTNYFE